MISPVVQLSYLYQEFLLNRRATNICGWKKIRARNTGYYYLGVTEQGSKEAGRSITGEI